MNMSDLLIATGSWSKNIFWELYKTSTLPPAELCTAVMCVAVAGDRIVLARSGRGWGMLGGHIENGETLDDALFREAREEGGFSISDYEPFAVRKITVRTPEPNRTGASYPFPTSYIVYYWATTDQPIDDPTGEEIIESGSFASSDVGVLNTPDQPIIEAGWKEYAKHVGLLPK
ncbi:MAG TPA: NUDIX domain-containing protein [Candidatus Saccharimonadales bacterium]|nr:NUDIX domain-containing protein [Candidatus Saccharimonadales bacterium]